MDLRQMRYVITIAKEKNITKAAERLYESMAVMKNKNN